MAAAWTLTRKQSSPVMRWHSETSGISAASSAIRDSCPAAGRMRANAVTGSPRAAALTSTRYPVMTPARSMRWTRSVTAGADIPTRRASADMVMRGSACS
jgi:hypothetical protein